MNNCVTVELKYTVLPDSIKGVCTDVPLLYKEAMKDQNTEISA